MLTKIMKSPPATALLLVLLLALLWPSSAGYLILLGAVCAGAIWGAHASSAGKYSGEPGYATVPRKVKYEN